MTNGCVLGQSGRITIVVPHNARVDFPLGEGDFILVRRTGAILLLFAFLGLGSGALSWLHNLAHEQEDTVAAADLPAGSGQPSPLPHDETNCNLHAMLRAPIASTGCVPLLVLIGLFLACVSQ